jgi:cellulose synthase/poly-beta-1,6-N-acetylglucosamine synthase-like glycosyltransferase
MYSDQDFSPVDARRPTYNTDRPYDRFDDRLSSAMPMPQPPSTRASDSLSSGATRPLPEQQRGQPDPGHAAPRSRSSYSSLEHVQENAALKQQSGLSRTQRGAARRAVGTKRLGRKRTPRKAHEMTQAERDLRLLSSKAAEAYAPTRLDKFLIRHGLIKLYFFIVMIASFAAPIGVLIAEEMTKNFAQYGRYVWRIATGLTLTMTVPMWIAMLQWRPAYPMNGSPPEGEDVPTVDIAICTYKEDVGEIVDTIVACQRVEYAEGMLHVYVLDDGHRAEMKEVCRQLQRSDLLRHRLTYVDRPDNKGKKAGNINHWLREYEHESGEFFIILDADMQPFPDMLDILMGHFYGLTPFEQEICAFIQTPQFYRNYNGKKAWSDLYNISEFFFYRVLQPAMSNKGCTVYVGCCALWSRRAIESIGGFIGGYATEDSVTGCQINRTLVPGTDYRWISKFALQPVAAGVSPDNLPALLEQRLRWYHGLCQMFGHHDGYIFAKGLTPMQRVLFWVCSASYIANIINYFTVFAGTLILLGSITYYSYLGTLGTLSQWAFFAGPGALLTTLFVWSFIPGCTTIQFVHTMSTVFLYTPVYAAAILRHYFNVKIKIQTTAVEAGGTRRWHKFFLMPVISITIILAGSITAAVAVITTKGEKSIAPIVQIPIWVLFWFFVHYHFLAAMSGFAYREIGYFNDEAQGEFSGESVKAHLARHQAMLDLDGDFSDEEGYDDENSGEDEIMSSSVVTGSSDSSREGDKSVSPLSAQERREIAATLNFHLARRRAIAETIIADKFARGLRDGEHDEEADEQSADDRFQRRFLGTSVERSAGARQSAQPGAVFSARNSQSK